MKQDKWTQQLHDKLAEHETAAPADLWADIESAISQGQSQRGRFVALRRRAAAAAVATILVGGGLVWWWQEEQQTDALLSSEDGIMEAMALDSSNDEDGYDGLLADDGENQNEPRAATPSPSKGNITIRQGLLVQETGNPLPSSHDGKHDQQDSAEYHQQDSATSSKKQTVPHVSPPLPEEPRVVTLPHRAKRQPGFSLYAMNGFGTQDNSNAVMMADALVKNYANAYNNGEGVSAGRQAPIYLTGYEEHQHHYQPVAFGLSVSYPLSQRLSLTSGVVYTQLKSEFTQTIHSQHIRQDQVLHYVGVPLGLSYRLWRYGGFSVYAAAGLQADWNVSTRLEVEGVEQEMKRDEMQWSANSSLGLQYNILPQLSFYAEPGFNYHFNNGSPVRNFFKDKPANLKLQIGLRIDLSPASIPDRYGRAR